MVVPLVVAPEKVMLGRRMEYTSVLGEWVSDGDERSHNNTDNIRIHSQV